MRYSFYIITLVLSFLMNTPSYGQSNIKGVGALTCSQLAQQVAESSDDDGVTLLVSTVTWAQGYMSGRNVDEPETAQKDLTALTGERLFDRIITLCQFNGDAYLFQIAEAIYSDLPPLLTADI